MGAAVYADRAFISVNGVELINLQRSQLRQNFNAKPVDSMTNDGFNRGFVQGNTHIDIALTLAVEQTVARPKLDQIDFKVNDISITYAVGADLFIAQGCFKKDATDDSGGVGTESTFAFNMGATRLVDAIGNPVNFDINLA